MLRSRYMYWEDGDGLVERADVDGSNRQVLLFTERPTGLAVDDEGNSTVLTVHHILKSTCWNNTFCGPVADTCVLKTYIILKLLWYIFKY